jgi:hypothetical protein
MKLVPQCGCEGAGRAERTIFHEVWPRPRSVG